MPENNGANSNEIKS